MTPAAITRGVPASISRALSAVTPDPPIDLLVAREQHLEYRAALETLGLAVELIDADDACPDCQFIEDTAVVAGGVALITRPGAPSRQHEGEAVARVLGSRLELARMTAPATLDGGDCLILGRTIFVGRSARTNAAGIDRLAAVTSPHGFRVVAVDLPPGVLHLKCVCSPLGSDRVLLARESIAPDVFAGAGVVWAPVEETYAANAVAFGGGVLVSDGFPRTRDALAAAGFRVVPVPTTEARKADGALTCMSILVGTE
jgi:dimethylargininase